MIDTEVMRLRRLRNTVLRARALAAELEAAQSRRNSLFSRTAVNCWQIARVVTGRLRAHPYLNYQRGIQGELGTRSLMASRQGRRPALLPVCASGKGLSEPANPVRLKLHRVAHELDDARALTWSADLSDTFGRLQAQIRRLIAEVDGPRHVHLVPGVDACAAEQDVEIADLKSSDQDISPYLAL